MRTITLGLLLLLPSAAFAQPQNTYPEFSGKYYLTAIYSNPMNADSIKLQNFLTSNPRMRALIETTNFNEWHDGMAIVQTQAWKTALGTARPCLLLQGRDRGNDQAEVVYFARGAGIDWDKVPDQISKAIKDYKAWLAAPTTQRGRFQPFQNCPDGKCIFTRPRQPQPNQPGPDTPPPAAPPTVVKPIEPTVDIELPKGEELTVDEPAPEESGGLNPLLLLLPILGGGFAAYQHVKDKASRL